MYYLNDCDSIDRGLKYSFNKKFLVKKIDNNDIIKIAFKYPLLIKKLEEIKTKTINEIIPNVE